MRWHYRDALLLWLFPAAYAFHILEEWFGGFPEWIAVFAGAPLPRPAFVLINSVAMLVVVLATHTAARDEKHGWMAIAVAAVLLVNGLLHIGASLVTGTYSPGLFTSMILYLPLAQLALLRAWFQASRGLLVKGLLAGAGAHALVSAVALIAARG